VIDVGDDGEIADVLHGATGAGWLKKGHERSTPCRCEARDSSGISLARH
jgi:hypothetical protein